jgi:hypothetical protein
MTTEDCGVAISRLDDNTGISLKDAHRAGATGHMRGKGASMCWHAFCLHSAYVSGLIGLLNPGPSKTVPLAIRSRLQAGAFDEWMVYRICRVHSSWLISLGFYAASSVVHVVLSTPLCHQQYNLLNVRGVFCNTLKFNFYFKQSLRQKPS